MRPQTCDSIRSATPNASMRQQRRPRTWSGSSAAWAWGRPTISGRSSMRREGRGNARRSGTAGRGRASAVRRPCAHRVLLATAGSPGLRRCPHAAPAHAPPSYVPGGDRGRRHPGITLTLQRLHSPLPFIIGHPANDAVSSPLLCRLLLHRLQQLCASVHALTPAPKREEWTRMVSFNLLYTRIYLRRPSPCSIPPPLSHIVVPYTPPAPPPATAVRARTHHTRLPTARFSRICYRPTAGRVLFRHLIPRVPSMSLDPRSSTNQIAINCGSFYGQCQSGRRPAPLQLTLATCLPQRPAHSLPPRPRPPALHHTHPTLITDSWKVDLS